MKGRPIITIASFVCLLLISAGLHAQDPFSRFRGLGNMGGGGGQKGADTLVHRKADTITLNFRYLDSTRYQKLDSSVWDFSKKVPQPPTYIILGNNGSPARDLVFTPRMNSGWDPGFHAYDLYTFKVDETRFYHTTNPYTELGYFIGSKSEQMIDVQHTQNIRPNWNFGFEYRLINTVGSFQNINTNHNNYRLHSWYQSRNKRYQNFFILVASKLSASDNGGLQNPTDLDSLAFTNQATLPVHLGQGLSRASSNPFAPVITTGTRYNTSTWLMRQQYDLGQKDSIVTDTSVIPLFYPRLRLEHTFSYSAYRYQFTDYAIPGTYTLDSSYYADQMARPYIQPTDSFMRRDKWSDVSNDFSFYTFPDSKNPQQFLKLGAALQLLKGTFDTSTTSVVTTAHKVNGQNAFVHGEYRNKTRNQKWDIEAFGKLYLNGLNAGDYNAYIHLRGLIARRVGYLELGFQNTNRTPSFIFDQGSSFYLDTSRRSFSKENTTNLFASFEQPQLKLKLKGSYYLMTNYAYYEDYYKQRQTPGPFNILQITAQKEFTVGRHWKWRALAVVQQVAGSSPVHVPLLTMFNQFGYEGSLGFPNLLANFGTEVRYISPYKADGYVPLSGQFFSQSDTTVRQRLPDISFYLHLRIRAFTAYLRAENINSIAFGPVGFGWYHNNFVTPYYPTPGLLIRFGFFWGFVN
ncbi:MAG TPA: putative porin [Puia sp.]|nr:putative porin [Puia sp.]